MSDVSLLSRRILSLRLPRLATDRLRRRAAGAFSASTAARTVETRSDGAPLAVFEHVGSALRLAAVDAAAARLGLVRAMPVADARARVPDLRLVARDRDGESGSLAAIVDWCDRFTPLVGLDPTFPEEAGLLLDVGAATHLFGGEKALVDTLVAALARHGLAAVAVLAGSVDCARALARTLAQDVLGGSGDAVARVIPAGSDVRALAPLPVAALDPDEARAAALARLGLGTVGALFEVPRAALARRFGADLVDRLDAAAGRLDRPIVPRRPVADLVAERAFAEPLVARDDVATVVRSLAEGLADTLESRGLGLRAAELALWRVDGTVRRVRVGTGRPTRDPDLLLALFAERLKGEESELDPGFGIDLVRLSVPLAGPADPTQIDLSGGDARLDFDRLIDRLGARLGARRITRAVPVDAHLPEAAVAALPASSEAARAAAGAWTLGPAGDADDPPERPLRLFERPEPIDTVAELPDGPPLRFRWRRAFHEVVRVEGPERIAADWWRLAAGLGPEGELDGEGGASLDAAPDDGLSGAVVRSLPTEAATRDYFRVEDGDGRRFWIFRAGLFGRETGRPRWFLHGLFA